MEACSSSTSLDVLHEMLVLPQPKQTSRKRRKALNSKAICITDSEVLDELKVQEAAKFEEELKKERKKLEREEKRKNKVLEEERKKNLRDSKKREKEQPRTERKLRPKAVLQETTASHTKERKLEEVLQDLTIDSDHENLILTRMKRQLFVQFVASFIQTMVDFGLGAMDVMTGLTSDVNKSKKHVPDVY